MASSGVKGKVSSGASSSEANTVDASPSKPAKKEKGGGITIKLKKPAPKIKNAGNWMKAEVVSDKKDGSPQVASAPSPIVNELDDKAIASFATGHPVTDEPDVVVCKHCKKAILKTIAASHTKECAKQKAEKLRKKKEAKEALAREKEAREAKEKAKETAAEADAKAKDAAKDKPAEDGEGADKMKTAKKGTVLGEGKTAAETKKSKKRKADEDAEKAPKQKKKKEEPKPKVAKPKGPVDVEKQCGVPLPNGAQCARSLTCKSHSMGAKRAVPGRSLPYDMLLSVYQKKNQAKQQKAAIDANAPLEDLDNNLGPIDSDEEKDTIMAAIARSRPQPLAQPIFVPTRRKYQYVRMKGLLSGALGGSRGGGLFSTGDSNARNFFGGGDASSFSGSPVMSGGAEASGQFDTPTSRKGSLVHQAAVGQGRKASTASIASQA